MPNFAPPREWNALPDEVALALQKVFGLAVEDALGIEARAGCGQVCFELPESAGLWIVPKMALPVASVVMSEAP